MIWAFGILAMFGGILVSQTVPPQTLEGNLAEVEATRLLVWHHAAVRYAIQNPNTSGFIGERNPLTLPEGYQKDNLQWKTCYEGGVVATFTGPDVERKARFPSGIQFAEALSKMSDRDVSAGYVAARKIKTPAHGLLVHVPNCVPDGVAAILTRIRS